MGASDVQLQQVANGTLDPVVLMAQLGKTQPASGQAATSAGYYPQSALPPQGAPPSFIGQMYGDVSGAASSLGSAAVATGNALAPALPWLKYGLIGFAALLGLVLIADIAR